jgi:hypothetical protein
MKFITIPTGTNSCISIPAKTNKPRNKSRHQPRHQPRHPLGGDIEPIGVSISDAATMAGVSVCRFVPYLKDGTIRTVRFGKRVIVSVQSLRDFIDGTKEPCDPEKPNRRAGK